MVSGKGHVATASQKAMSSLKQIRTTRHSTVTQLAVTLSGKQRVIATVCYVTAHRHVV